MEQPHQKIIHIDMDAFFASVEQLDHPELRDKPVVVGGTRERGVIAAASYEARKFGIYSAMSSKFAERNFRIFIFVKLGFDRIVKVFLQLETFFFNYTVLLEPFSFNKPF